jgi:hypothetical protein
VVGGEGVGQQRGGREEGGGGGLGGVEGVCKVYVWWVGGAFVTLAWAVVMGKKTSLERLTVGEGVVCMKNTGQESLGKVYSGQGEAEEMVKMSMFQSIVSIVGMVGLRRTVQRILYS